MHLTEPVQEKPAISRLAYTVDETAASLGISPWSVYRLLRTGKLRSAGQLRHKVIPHFEIDRYLRENLN